MSNNLLHLNVDPLISNDVGTFSPSRTRCDSEERLFRLPTLQDRHGEQDPLLGGESPRKKPFYRARPMWLVPFALAAALVRGMTVAPRVEVIQQLSCNIVHRQFANLSAPSQSTLSPLQHIPLEINSSSPAASSGLPFLSFHFSATPLDSDASNTDEDEDVPDDDPREIPSPHCLSDPNVQATAVRLQTIMVITTGALSALTTGWWGHFGERYGRTKVLAATTFGFFLTDLAFILASTPKSLFAAHGHKLLYAAPVIEGLLGGWSTFQSATSAYISDCTSSGSRAQIFSRFTGVFYLGFSIGPGIGGWLIRSSPWIHLFDFLGAPPSGKNTGRQTVTAVFWTSVICSFVNFVLVLFIFPESLSKEQRAAAQFEHNGQGKGKARASPTGLIGDGDENASTVAEEGILRRLLSPLAIFLPVYVFDQNKMRKRKDWSLTYLAIGLFCYMLTTGIYQIKYLYATHVYGWSAEQLSYYISFLGGSRAVHLLFVLPFIITTLKPVTGKKPKPTVQSNVGHLTGNNIRYVKPSPPSPPAATGSKGKPKITKAQLAREIQFDLHVARISLVLDIIGNGFVAFAPAPAYKAHTMIAANPQTPSQRHSQALFVLASGMSCFGSGMLPAVQSLSLCLLQARELSVRGDEPVQSDSTVAVGKLFGALATLQSVGQMIIGPILFGVVYSNTVATFPKGIFVTAAVTLSLALTFVLLVRSPIVPRSRRRTVWVDDIVVERGRSRVSKDLRRDLPFGIHSSYGGVDRDHASDSNWTPQGSPAYSGAA